MNKNDGLRGCGWNANLSLSVQLTPSYILLSEAMLLFFKTIDLIGAMLAFMQAIVARADFLNLSVIDSDWMSGSKNRQVCVVQFSET